MSYDPPSPTSFILEAIEAIVERMDATNERLDKILTALKLLYEARR